MSLTDAQARQILRAVDERIRREKIMHGFFYCAAALAGFGLALMLLGNKE